jgi:hypothetical protein
MYFIWIHLELYTLSYTPRGNVESYEDLNCVGNRQHKDKPDIF